MALIANDVEKWRSSWRKKKNGALLSIVGIRKIDDVIKEAVKRAYAPSVQNTALKNGKYGNKLKLPRKLCTPVIEKALSTILNVSSENDFETWEKDLAEEIRRIYRTNGISLYTYGNAQKWINMSLKYIFSADSVDFSKTLFEVCYLPIDSVIQTVAKRNLQVEPLREAWSKCDDWEEIQRYQKNIKKAIVDITDKGTRLWWECSAW